jgi:glycosyltransferase involved in cell wall biosynthesis
MAAGVPVVASRAGALPETAGDAALLVPPGDPAALARGLRSALDDAELRARLIGRGRLRARDFAPEATARAWLAVLLAVAGPR